MSRLRELVDEAEELGIEEPMADVVAGYVDAAKKAASAYRDFHWGEPSEGGELIWLPPPAVALTEIGPLVEVVYEASKRSQFAHWEHAFEDQRPVLAFDEMGGDQLYILGGDYKVTPRGIVG